MRLEKDKRERARLFIDEEDKTLREQVQQKLVDFEEKHQMSRELRLQNSNEKLYGENGVHGRNQRASEKFDDIKKDIIT